MYCHSCGKEIGEYVRFCQHCGAEMDASTMPGGSLYEKPPYKGPAIPGQEKSRLAAGILALLVGQLGIHNFYLGYKNKAIAQLALSVLSCGFLVLPVWIWAVIEGIMIFNGNINKDADGVFLKD